MQTNTILTHGNTPLSAACLSERLDEVLVKLRQELDQMVDSVGASGFGPESFREMTSSLRASTAAAALEAFVAVVEAADVASPTIERDRRVLRFRGSAPSSGSRRSGWPRSRAATTHRTLATAA